MTSLRDTKINHYVFRDVEMTSLSDDVFGDAKMTYLEDHKSLVASSFFS